MQFGAVRTKQAAEHKSKLERVHTAILNWQGYDPNGPKMVYWWNNESVFRYGDWDVKWYSTLMTFRFDTNQNAKDCANHANELMRKIEAGEV